MRTVHRHGQRGAVTLAVTLALLMAMLITLLAANRHLLVEWRQSSNQVHAAAAFEAAEAGLDWVTAMLNHGARIGSDCRPSPLATQSFRERHLDDLERVAREIAHGGVDLRQGDAGRGGS